jgi:S-adenosylmethionine:tRNA ribosyltransferase-isomerase
LHTKDFDYSLPKGLIAQTPLESRDDSRLLILDRSNGVIRHSRFRAVSSLLRPGDLLVFNDSRVIRARLNGGLADSKRDVELLLLRSHEPSRWWCIGKPSRKIVDGARIIFEGGLEGIVVEAADHGMRLIEFNDEKLIEIVGKIPLPPYIHETLNEVERYQTVYAKNLGSVAAPTAGLHFTTQLLEDLQVVGINMAFVTLHVGLDTFRPVDEHDPRNHKIHSEYWEISEETAKAINRAIREGRRIVAVGTTTVRTLEQVSRLMDAEGSDGVAAGSGWADIFIMPGHTFRLVDAMITNFHLPRSTLLMLVSAFAGGDQITKAYDEAIRLKYRFYSFGDAMLIF